MLFFSGRDIYISDLKFVQTRGEKKIIVLL